mgnify:CR=1 FL=1|tara:strand:+ start:4046 stop:5416 length:1371 start_codon:yes stop_codon:yes gene_type:complete
MSSNTFERSPQKVKFINTKYREIKTKIPCHGTEEVLKKLDTFESRSMHGQLPLVWDSAYDSNIFDSAGNKFLDFTSAIFFANVGHSNDRVSKYMMQTLKKPITGCYAYGNSIRAEYLEKLVDFAGTNFEKAFLMSAGTEATEAAFKLMRMNGQKIKKERLGIIAFENNWHGRTTGAQMMSGNLEQKKWIGNLDKDIHHLKFPYEWSLNGTSGKDFFEKQINKLISDGIDPSKDICGMIFETFQGWGAIFYPKDFVIAASEFAKKYGILIAFDEMQSGFGRTGKPFGYMHYDIEPDLLCCGKGMGNGYPLSGVIGKSAVMDLPEIGNMSSTHSANPLACSAGLAVIDEIQSNDLINETIRKGRIFKDKLDLIKEKSKNNIAYINAKGLIGAILFQDPITKEPVSDLPSKVCELCLQKGLLVVHTGRESIKLGPPLNITDEALIEGLEVIEEVILDNT